MMLSLAIVRLVCSIDAIKMTVTNGAVREALAEVTLEKSGSATVGWSWTRDRFQGLAADLVAVI